MSPPPRRAIAERPPGPVADCIACSRWAPGALVLRGSTVGTCSRDGRARSADSWCPEHDPVDGRQPA